MVLQPRNSIDRFRCYLQRRFSESLGLTPDDIDELVEDLSHWGICDSEKFEKHLLLADRHFDGISDKASGQYAALYNCDLAHRYYKELSILDCEDYLFFFHGDF